MAKQTALYQAHVDAGGQIVEFGGWSMPVNYGSQIAEHVAVRTDAGMFDVSHMTIVDVSGAGALSYLQKMVANDVAKLALGQALYGALLNEQGGIVDDLIVYATDSGFRCVVNAATRDKVMPWLEAHVEGDVVLAERDLSMIAVQGPNAIAKLQEACGVDVADLKPFFSSTPADREDWMIGRTGYTGEDGVEVMLPGADACQLWDDLKAAGVAPAGLGARDTLRLEAGLNLYGQDMDDGTTPLESNIAWTVTWVPEDRAFIGRSAIEPLRGQSPRKLTGLILRDKGVLRHGQVVHTDAGDGVITSGTFSPTMECSIALARVPAGAEGECTVDIRGKEKKAEIVKPPFVRNGKIRVQ